MPKERKSLHATLLDMARVLCDSRSPCPGGSTGCIIATKEGRILACGYNGPPHGWNDALDVCVRDELELHGGIGYEVCPCVHAEANAVAHAARHGIPLDGAIAFCTRKPCATCGKVLVQAGVRTAYYQDQGEIKEVSVGLIVMERMNDAREEYGCGSDLQQ